MSKKLVTSVTVLACVWICTITARVGGYSHRGVAKPAPAPQPTVVQPPGTAPSVTPPQAAPPTDAPVATMSELLSAPVVKTVQPTMSASKLIQTLERQNNQLREQITSLEQEGKLLLRRNRQLLADKRRLQKKRRRLVEKLDALEERILEMTSRHWRQGKQLAMRTKKENDA